MSRILSDSARARKILIGLEARLKLDSSFLFVFEFGSRKKTKARSSARVDSFYVS